MENSENCLVTIRSIYPSLSKVEARISDYILDNDQNIINMTISNFAQQVEVAESSIIRFCRRLGYDGFTSLKINLAKNTQSSKEYVLDEISIDEDSVDPMRVTAKVFSSISRTLSETLQIIDSSALERTVDLLCSAKKIVFYGVGTSATIATDAYYRFMRIGLPTSASIDPHIMMISASMLNKDCVAVGISHTGCSKETIRAMRIAHDCGATTICITSYVDSPITKYSDVRLVTSASESKIMREAVTSRIAHISLLDSIYTCIALRKYDIVHEKIDSMHELLQDARL